MVGSSDPAMSAFMGSSYMNLSIPSTAAQPTPRPMERTCAAGQARVRVQILEIKLWQQCWANVPPGAHCLLAAQLYPFCGENVCLLPPQPSPKTTHTPVTSPTLTVISCCWFKI